MKFTLELSDSELLSNPGDMLFRLSLELQQRVTELETTLRGAPLSVGEFRGVVTGFGEGNVQLRNEAGTVKSVPLNRTRARQLLAATTTRK